MKQVATIVITVTLSLLVALLQNSCKEDDPPSVPIVDAIPPTVSTHPASSITDTTAQSGGNVTSAGSSAVTARGVCWSTATNPSLSDQHTTDGSGTGAFISDLPGLSGITTYYVRAYATNATGTSYGNQISFIADAAPTLPSVITTPASNITQTTATSGGEVTSDGGSPVTARGVCWSTSPNPSLSDQYTTDGSGTGTFISNLSGLMANTPYYVRSYATTGVGTAYGDPLNFTTDMSTPDYPHGFVHCDTSNPTAVVDVTNPTTGRTWMDRNLGASQIATSSADSNAYGDLYQWGRFADGHHCRNSATTITLSSTDQPGHGHFILAPNTPFDWRSPQNDNLWQGVNGVNNPCPAGYSLPTEAELNAERLSWSSNNADGAYGSPLKLTISGRRKLMDGMLTPVLSYGYYWSSSISSTQSRMLRFNSTEAIIGSYLRAQGYSVRCIKDN